MSEFPEYIEATLGIGCLPYDEARRLHEVLIAERIARQAHEGQIEESTGDPYIRHVERVVALCPDRATKAVAWLHDVLEDTPLDGDALRDAGISTQTIAAVLVLTRDLAQPYATYIERVKASGDRIAIAVKLADLADHLRPNRPPRLRARYESALLALRDA